MEELPINTDTINKAIDIIQDSTKETRQEIDKTAAQGFNKLSQLLWASPLGIKAEVYIQERPYKLTKALKEMQMKYAKKVPVEYQVEPSAYVALKSANELNYCLDEEHLKEMFENLLISDMDNRKQNKVLPSYIDIIKQLSKEDASFLTNFKNLSSKAFPLIMIKHSVTSGHTALSSIGKELVLSENNIVTLNEVVIDNLERLHILKIYDDVYMTSSNLYEIGFNKVKNKYHTPGHIQFEITYIKGVLKITDLGSNFIDICLS